MKKIILVWLILFGFVDSNAADKKTKEKHTVREVIDFDDIVRSVKLLPSGDAEVTFQQSPAFFKLFKTTAKFKELIVILEESQKQNSYVTFHYNIQKMNITDVVKK